MGDQKEDWQLDIGQLIGNYTISGFIGKGGMGEVYSAFDPKLKREVAIKVLPEKYNSNKAMLDRFLAEGAALAKISHPNIVSVFEIGTYSGGHFIAMEFIDGISLNHLIKERTFDTHDAISIMLQVLSALELAHQKSIIHRDIKPHNLILDTDGNIKIIDFGIVKDLSSTSSHETTVGLVLGSISYVSPEVLTGKVTTPQADLWSAGVTFFEILSGVAPFDGDNNLETMENIKTKSLEFPEDFEAWYPKELKTLIQKLCKVDISQRYLNATEALEDLKKIEKKIPDFQGRVKVKLDRARNESEVREYLKDFRETEALRILQSAIQIQKQLDYSTDKTIALDDEASIEVSEQALQMAKKKFRESTRPPLFVVPLRFRAAVVAGVLTVFVAVTLVFTTIIDPETSVSQSPERGVSNYTGTECDPFVPENADCATRGLTASLFYLTEDSLGKVKGNEYDLNQYTRLSYYFNEGVRSSETYQFSQPRINPRMFKFGSLSSDGKELVDNAGSKLTEYFALRFTSMLFLNDHEPGEYEFLLSSDDGSRLYVFDDKGGKQLVVDNDGPHSMNAKCSEETVYFDKDTRKQITIEFYQGPRYFLGLQLLWRRVDGQRVPESNCGLEGSAALYGPGNDDFENFKFGELIKNGWEVIPAENFLMLPNY